MILLDFYSGSHGHFLEYVINTYIFKGPQISDVFTSSGTSHNIISNPVYIKAKKLHAGHFTEKGNDHRIATNNPTHVVRVTISDFKSIVCYQLNVANRVGDISAIEKEKSVPEIVRANDSMLRNDYYSKLQNPEYGCPLPANWIYQDLPAIEFPMSACYDQLEFYTELLNLSKFLNHSFNPDESLQLLWQQFIDKNHGVNSWNRCHALLPYIASGRSYTFQLSIQEQALLNLMLTRSFNVYDGVLFENNTYPTNTKDIWDAIKHHITTFDLRF